MALPAQVEQTRILTWFQFHLTLVTLLVAIVVGVILSGRKLSYLGADDAAAQQLDRVMTLMLVLAGTAVLLAVAAATMRRGWTVSFPVLILAEIAVLASNVLAARAGAFLGLIAVLLLALGGWIVANMFRAGARAFMMR
jgi:hypothetical protein